VPACLIQDKRSSMQKIRCQCGQSFAAVAIDGAPRTHCPVCKRAMVAVIPEPLLAQVVEEEDPVTAQLVEAQPIASQLAAGAVPQQDIAGLWRDGEFLVVDRYRHKFPLRCVMTNQPLYGQPQPISLDYLPNRWAWSLLGRSIGRAIGRSLHGEQVLLAAGILPDWQRANDLRRLLGTLAVWAGALLAIPATLLQSASRVATGERATVLAVLSAGLLLAMLCLLGGGIAVLIYSAPLRVSTIQGGFVWLRGANASFLATLPAWPRR
jgi:hypothetical protein